MEKLLKKLRKLLGKAGLEEEKIESIVSEVQSEDEETDSEPVGEKEPVETSPEKPSETPETPSSESESKPEETPVEHEGGEGEGGEGEPSTPVVPTETPTDVVPPTETPVEPTEPTEPVAPVEPVEPEVDYKTMYEESQKVVDALTKRVDSMEDALKKANILRDEAEQVGLGNGSGTPANDAEGDPMSAVLSKLNRGF